MMPARGIKHGSESEMKLEWFYCWEDLDCPYWDGEDEIPSLVQCLIDSSCWNCPSCDMGLSRSYDPRNTLDMYISL